MIIAPFFRRAYIKTVQSGNASHRFELFARKRVERPSFLRGMVEDDEKHRVSGKRKRFGGQFSFVKPRLIKIALLTRFIVEGGSSPMRSFKRRLSMVRICSKRMTLSFANP